MTDNPKTTNLTPPVKRSRGIRPPSILVKEEDWKIFNALCFAQATLEEIALYYAVSTRTIERAVQRAKKTTFVRYYGQKRVGGNVSLRRKQMELAMKGNVTMLIWLGKQYLGQADKQVVAGDFHHEHDHEFQYESLGDEELRKELERTQRDLADNQRAIDSALQNYGLEEAINSLAPVGGSGGSADAITESTASTQEPATVYPDAQS
jgi:hypothetical protein